MSHRRVIAEFEAGGLPQFLFRHIERNPSGLKFQRRALKYRSSGISFLKQLLLKLAQVGP